MVPVERGTLAPVTGNAILVASARGILVKIKPMAKRLPATGQVLIA
jgi:hypothetical protein